MKNTALPEPLSAVIFKNYLVAVIISALIVLFAVTSGDFRLLALLIMPAYFVVRAMSLSKAYKNGQIAGRRMVCQSMQRSVVLDGVIVTFLNDSDSGIDDEQKYHRFNVPGRRSADNFTVGAEYMVYFNVSDPSALVAYSLV